MRARRSLKVVGATTAAVAAGVLLLASYFSWSPNSPARQRHPESDNPHELLEEAEHLFWLNNPVEAQPLYAKSERLFEGEGDSRNALYAKISQIPAEMERRNLAELSEYLRKELRRPGIENDPHLRLRLLVVKGQVDLNLDGLSSRPVWTEVEELANKLKERALASRASGELGILAFLEGKPEEAKWRVGKAVAFAKLVKDIGAEIRYLSMIGRGFAEGRRPDEAMKYLDSALEKAAKNPDTGFPKLAATTKVSLLTETKRYDEARVLLSRALEYARARKLTGYEVDILAQFGVLATRTADLHSAIQFYEKAAEKASKLQFLRAIAEVNAKLALLYGERGDLKKAMECARVSAGAHRSLGETYAIPHHLAIEANLLARLGELHTAERLFRKAADVTEGMVLNAASLTGRRMVIGAMSEVYVGYFVLAADRLGDLEKAFRVIEEARGRVAADSLRGLRNRNRSVDEPPNALELRIASLNDRLLDSDDPTERAWLKDAIFEAEQELTPDGSPPPREKPVSLRRFQDDLEAQEVALEYVLSEPNSYCLVITRRHVRLVKLAGSRETKALVTEYRNAIDKMNSDELSQRLSAALLEPIREYHESRDVVIIPDGVLNLIPFEGLRSSAEGYGLNRHSFTVAPSGTVLHLLRTGQKRSVARTFPGVSASPPAGVKKGKSGLGVFRGLLEFRRSDLAALPSTETEVRSIAKMISGDATTLMGDKATEAAFKSEPISAVQVMHLALHGLTDNAFPDRSALVFSAGGGPQEDGLLQAREIRKLPINAELVTLSACDAGTGRIEGQEGVASLVQAFLDTGAKSVVASLWPAEDTYTKGLMEAFYRHLARGESKREALRLAKIDMLGQFGDTVPPLYWAGFVLIGDGSGKIAFGGAP